jgi:hypothetical protein
MKLVNRLVSTMVVALVAIIGTSSAVATVGGSEDVKVEILSVHTSVGLVCTNSVEHGMSHHTLGVWDPGWWEISSFCNGDQVTVTNTDCATSTVTVNGTLLGASDTASASSSAKVTVYTLSHSQYITWDPLAETYVGHVDVGVSKTYEEFCLQPIEPED